LKPDVYELDRQEWPQISQAPFSVQAELEDKTAPETEAA